MKIIQITCCLMILILSSACSRASNPVVPAEVDKNPSITISEVKDISGSSQNPNRSVFGAWKVVLDTENLTAEVIPARNAQAIGNIFDSDLSQFLTVSPCSNCMWIPYLYKARDDNFIMGIRMRHPFPNLISRPDLHGFDVRAIFIGGTSVREEDGINMMKPDGTQEPCQFKSYFLLNPDGWTSHYDELVNDERYFIGGSDVIGNLNGFMRFFEDYQVPPFDPHNPDGQNVMAVGAGNYTRDAVIYRTATYSNIEFYVVADVAYGQSATFINRANPQYYLPAFHRTEPWRVEYYMDNNNLVIGDDTSTGDLVVQVFDWQHGATVDPEYPNPDNLSGIPESSNVLQVELTIDSLFSGTLIETTTESGTGSPSDPLIYRFTITNELGSIYSRHTGAIAVRDQLHGDTAPSGRLPVPESPSGFPYETVDIRDYSLYRLVTVNIPNGEYGPFEHNAELTVIDRSTYDQGHGDLEVDVDFFMDSSHKRFEYHWDYNFDGVTFDVDGAGLPSPEIPVEPGINELGLRVRTNTVPPREHIYTVPVYGQGTGWNNEIASPGTWQGSSRVRSNSVAMTEDYIYSAYTNGSPADWTIMLAIGDKRTGEFNSYEVAATPGIDYTAPAIVVVDDDESSNHRVYVVFEGATAIGTALYSNRGYLDGSGFSNDNIKTIVGPAILTFKGYPELVYDYDHDEFLVFYQFSEPSQSAIYKARSENRCQTWIEHGLVYDVPSPDQHYPTAIWCGAVTGGAFVVVWEDWSAIGETGKDLWVARSGNGSSWSDQHRLSVSSGNVDETSPDMSIYWSDIAIAYNQRPSGASGRNVHFMFTDYTLSFVADYEIAGWDNYDFSMPAISMDDEEKASLAFARYNTDTDNLKLHTYFIETRSGFGSIAVQSVDTVDLGTIPDPAMMKIYPAVVGGRTAGTYATDRFVTWQSYDNGSHEVTDPYGRYFGTMCGLYNIDDSSRS